MRLILASALLCLVSIPAMASVSDGKEFLRASSVGSPVAVKRQRVAKPVNNRVAGGARKHRAVARPHVATVGSAPLVEKARSYIGMNARQIGLRRYTLWCSTFLNHITGGGTGSDLARSWAEKKPRVSPQVGAVAVMSRGRRGGHVGIVSGFDGRGNPIVISGNHGNRVRETAYPARRIYAYVMP